VFGALIRWGNSGSRDRTLRDIADAREVEEMLLAGLLLLLGFALWATGHLIVR
jgi:hypothetical protein